MKSNIPKWPLSENATSLKQENYLKKKKEGKSRLKCDVIYEKVL